MQVGVRVFALFLDAWLAALVVTVFGTLLPASRAENERMGELSDRLMDAARETAQEAVERGKQVAYEAVDQGKQALDATKDSAREQGQELASTMQDRAQGATSA